MPATSKSPAPPNHPPPGLYARQKRALPTTASSSSTQSYEASPSTKPRWAEAGSHVPIDVWWGWLDRFHVDEEARATLYLLSQHSKAGHMEANRIMASVISRTSENCDPKDKIRSPGRFILKSATKARQSLYRMPQDTLEKVNNNDGWH